MPPPPQILQRLTSLYPKPAIDPDWLNACYEWVNEERNLGPEQVDEVFDEMHLQLLHSDLDNAMLRNTGLPPNVNTLNNIRIGGGPRGAILCQINAITEIGHSAFSLQTVRQTRIDKEDMAGLIEAGIEDEDEAAPIPKYPRSTLRMEISDGTITMRAMEYKRIPELQLGVTPLGCKMLLKNVLMREGIAFLEPASVTVIPNTISEDREAVQDADFARGLRLRMGQPDPPPDDNPRPQHPLTPPAPTAVDNNQPREIPRRQPSAPPQLRQGPPPNLVVPEREMDETDTSYDWGLDEEMDEDFLAEFDRLANQQVEAARQEREQQQETLASAQAPRVRASPPASQMHTAQWHGTFTTPAAPVGSASRNRPTTATSSRQATRVALDVIELDSSDDDIIDTQMTLVSQARRAPPVRRPAPRRANTRDEDVIEISD